MIASRLVSFPLMGLCALLVACSGKADKLTDVELARMLHTEGLGDERVDAAAVDCLRAWAGDRSLTSGLSAELQSDTGKSDCRRHMQGWLDDGSRNPQGLMFADITTPKLTRRAMDLLAALPPLAPVASAPTSTLENSAPVIVTPPVPAGEVDAEAAEADYQNRVAINNSTNQSIERYEVACSEAQAASKSRRFEPEDQLLINGCQKMAADLRAQLAKVISTGTPFEVSMATRSAEQQLQLLRLVLAK